MRIIISPAKKMKVDTDAFTYEQFPQFLDQTKELLTYLQTLSYEELKKIWKASDKISTENYERIQQMDLESNLTPAILSYEGIQYQHMGPDVFEQQQFDYLQEHLRILSGFYGILRPFDGVTPYRLEMQAKLHDDTYKSVYHFWSNQLAKQLFSETDIIINLASKEYSQTITKYNESARIITCVFGELKNDKVKEKGTLVKMTRGEMVRFLAENQITDVEKIKGFDRLNFSFSKEHSSDDTFVFIKQD